MNNLALNNLTFALPHVTKPIVNNISYLIRPGDFIILLGGNGSGKSSLLKLLTKQYLPSNGNILFDDQPLTTETIQQRVALLTQHPDHSLFTSLTVYENYLIRKQCSIYAFTHHKKEISFLQNYLKNYNAKLSMKLNTQVDQLSGGEKQALALALCFLQPPSLLLLDEHTSALDPKTSKEIMQLTQEQVAKNNITCILTTHDLDIALQYGNRILMLHDGHIHKMIETHEKSQLTRTTLMQHYY